MKTYNFIKNKNYLFIAPTGWGKTMGVVLPEANGHDDTLLFANLSSGQETLLSPFVTYVCGTSFADNRKKIEEVIAIAKTCPISRIIVDETAKLFDANSLADLLVIAEKRNIPVLLTFQSEAQARSLGIMLKAFEVINVDATGDAGFTSDDFSRMYTDFANNIEFVDGENKNTSLGSDSGPVPTAEDIVYVKKKTAPADAVAIDFDNFISRIATYTTLSPGLVMEILKDNIIPSVNVQ